MSIFSNIAVPVLVLFGSWAHADVNQLSLKVRINQPQNLHLQEDGSFEIYYVAKKKFLFHPQEIRPQEVTHRFWRVLFVWFEGLSSNSEGCALRDIKPPETRDRWDRLDQTVVYEPKDFYTSAKTSVHTLENAGTNYYVLETDLGKNVDEEHFRLTCYSDRPFSDQTFLDILSDDISISINPLN